MKRTSKIICGLLVFALLVPASLAQAKPGEAKLASGHALNSKQQFCKKHPKPCGGLIGWVVYPKN